MRFIFHNPHALNFYKPPLSFILEKRKSAYKYEYLLDYFIENEKHIYVYVDSYKTSIARKGIRKYLPPLIGFYAWIIINKMNPLRFKVITDADMINREDILFLFLYGNFTNQSGELDYGRQELNRIISKIEAFKVVHLTHYMYHASVGSANSKNANIDLFVAENNLFRNSRYFQMQFSWYKKDVYLLPNVPKEKFVNKKIFSDRISKAIATGTITLPMTDVEFSSYFKTSTLQPMRLEIYENRASLEKYIDSIISPIIENDDSNQKEQNDKQIKYFGHNIVELYNSYKMFIVPEEISGLPGIGFVEGMRCGSAFIGIIDPMYDEYGLKDGHNYIGYDGTMSDLKKVISYYQDNNAELEKIANNGYQLILKQFTKEKVCADLINEIKIMRNM